MKTVTLEYYIKLGRKKADTLDYYMRVWEANQPKKEIEISMREQAYKDLFKLQQKLCK